MGQFGGGALLRVAGLFLSITFLLPSFSLAGKPAKEEAPKRDPRQLTLIVADFDGTFGQNVGHYRLKRVFNPEIVTSLFSGVSGLPEEIAVPVNDFEGNTGPRIGLRIGKLNEHGRFIPSTSLDPIQLSDGQTIVPGYYYMDPQTAYREFRPNPDGKAYIVRNFEKKIKAQEPFLLEAYPFMNLAMSKKYSDRVRGAFLTMQGQNPPDMKKAINILQKSLGQESNEWPDEAFVNLTNPQFFEFAFSKGKYLRHAYDELQDRVMQNPSTPHFLVMLENDRQHLKDIDELFTALSNRGVFSNPVVPILVNVIEPEVFAQPDGSNWDDPPMKQITKMSRVTIYWPGRAERSNNMERVFELALGVSQTEARKILGKFGRNELMCPARLVGGGK